MYRPPISALAPYLYETWYADIDYAYAYQWFRSHTPVVGGGCSTVRKGNLIGRNLDWTYDESAEFIVHTDNVVGVANAVPTLTDAFVKSGQDSELYKIVPFMLSDGMNKYGLVVSTLVVPTDKGDNSVVLPYESEEVELCTLMLPRYVLDRFGTAADACLWLALFAKIYHPKTLQDQHYDQHFVIADENNMYCMEFVDGRYAVKDISSKPFVTNFHLTGVEFNADGSVNTPASGKASDNKITPNGSGLERYNLINAYSGSVQSLMRELAYTRAYQSSPNPAVPRWDTEFVGNGRTVDTPSTGFDAAQATAATMYATRVRDGATWQTVHSAVYDVQNKKLVLHSQENFDTQWEVSVMADQTHIQHLRGTTARNDAFTGDSGELTINLDSKSIRIHDGLKQGGYGTIDSAHYDGALPATVPNDLRTGAHVTQGTGHLDGGISTSADSLAGDGLIAQGGTLNVDVDNLAGQGLLSTGDALAVDLDTLDGRYVKTTGNESVDGTKTFLASPRVPTPELGDSSDKTANTAFIRQSMGAGLVYNPVSKQIETQLKVATGNVAFYVRKTGNDNNDGLTEGTAFLTIERAIQETNKWVLFQNSIIINIGAGSWSLQATTFSNISNIRLVGAGKDATTIALTGGINNVNGYLNILNMTISISSISGTGSAITSSSISTVYIENVAFSGTKAGIVCLYALSTSSYIFAANCSFNCTCSRVATATTGGDISFSGTLAISGTYANAIINSVNNSIILLEGVTAMSGTATGTRFNSSQLSVINTGGRGANFIPGSNTGVTSAGGIYL